MLHPFIDAHVHLNTETLQKLKMARDLDAYFVSINTEIPFFIDLKDQEKTVHKLNDFDRRIAFITSFNTDGINDADWSQRAIKQIKKGIEHGAKGVKIWKNIGMDANLKDPEGKFIMVDHPKLDPIYQYLSDNDILLIGHQGEPRNCWLPLDEMTVDSDRNYFSQHPEYHMYKNPEYPSYEEQMNARDHVLEKHPKMKYVGLHLFSMEYDIDQVAKRLDKYPNSKTDLAERICHIQLQAITNREKVRDFFIEYQDRIIYGTDVIDDGSFTGEEAAERLKYLWKYHWQFFSSADTMQAEEFKGNFQGLELPKEVLKKIFRENAIHTYQLNKDLLTF